MGDTFLLLARDGSCEQTLTEEVSPVGGEDSQDPKVRAIYVPCTYTARSQRVLGRLQEGS